MMKFVETYPFFEEEFLTWMNNMTLAKGITYDDLTWFDAQGEMLLQLVLPCPRFISNEWLLCTVGPTEGPRPTRYDLYAVRAPNREIDIPFQLLAYSRHTLPASRRVYSWLCGEPEVLAVNRPQDDDHLEARIMLNGQEILWFHIDAQGTLTSRTELLTEWSHQNLRRMLLELYVNEVLATEPT